MTPEPTLNRFQRWYFDWAEPHYQRLEPGLQQQARALDRFLYSRRSRGFWLGLVCALLGATGGLVAAGLPWWLALGLSLGVGFSLMAALVAAWLQPDKLVGRGGIGRVMVKVVGGTLLGVVCGWLAMRLLRLGWTGLDRLPDELERLLRVGLPLGLLIGLVLALLIGITASARRHQLQQELQRVQQAQERERMAREASEARLRLLQAQIQPHFIFNTLSAVQHWVDSGDARASALLRDLTAFLRGSAEQMLKPLVSLADELALVEHYLGVMQARWGERLRYQLDVDAGVAAAAQLPPGIVLSLVENALEHGIAPSLSGGELRLRLAAREGQAGGWTLQVRDSGVGLAEGWAEGLGLGNSRARLAHAFGGRAVLDLRAAASGAVAELSVAAEEALDVC